MQLRQREEIQEVLRDWEQGLTLDLNKKELKKLFDVLFRASVEKPEDAELSDLLMKVLEELQKKGE